FCGEPNVTRPECLANPARRRPAPRFTESDVVDELHLEAQPVTRSAQGVHSACGLRPVAEVAPHEHEACVQRTRQNRLGELVVGLLAERTIERDHQGRANPGGLEALQLLLRALQVLWALL